MLTLVSLNVIFGGRGRGKGEGEGRGGGGGGRGEGRGGGGKGEGGRERGRGKVKTMRVLWCSFQQAQDILIDIYYNCIWAHM